MKRIVTFIALLVVAVIAFRPAVVAAEEMECPGHGMNTLEGLAMCVQHAADMGAITNVGVTNSLLAKIGAAQSAVDRGQPAVAVQILQAFISEVQAQSGVQIDPEHAQHMISHAGQVIAALQ